MTRNNDGDGSPLLSKEKEDSSFYPPDYNQIEGPSSEKTGPKAPPAYFLASTDEVPLLSSPCPLDDSEAQLPSPRKSRCSLLSSFSRKTSSFKFSFRRAILYLLAALLIATLLIFITAVIYFHPQSIKQYMFAKKTLHIQDINFNGFVDGEPVSDVLGYIEFQPELEIDSKVWNRMSRWLDSKLEVDDSEYDVFVTPMREMFKQKLNHDDTKPVAKLFLRKYNLKFELEKPVVHLVNNQTRATILDTNYVQKLVELISSEKENMDALHVRIVGKPRTKYGWIAFNMQYDVEMIVNPAVVFQNIEKYNFRIEATKFLFPEQGLDDLAIAEFDPNSRHYTFKTNTSFTNPFPIHVHLPLTATLPIFHLPDGETSCSATLDPIGYIVVPNTRTLNLDPGLASVNLQANIPVDQLGQVFELMGDYQMNRPFNIRVGPGSYFEIHDTKDKLPAQFCVIQTIQKSSSASPSVFFSELYKTISNQITRHAVNTTSQASAADTVPIHAAAPSPSPSPAPLSPSPESQQQTTGPQLPSLDQILSSAAAAANSGWHKLGKVFKKVETKIEKEVESVVNSVMKMINGPKHHPKHSHRKHHKHGFKHYDVNENPVEIIEEITISDADRQSSLADSVSALPVEEIVVVVAP